MSESVKTLKRPDMSYSLLPNREMQPITMPTVTKSYFNKEKYEQYEMLKIV